MSAARLFTNLTHPYLNEFPDKKQKTCEPFDDSHENKK